VKGPRVALLLEKLVIRDDFRVAHLPPKPWKDPL
jgi:hypothetical protein